MPWQEILVPNGQFTEGFYNYQGIGELSVANSWLPWWQEGTRPGELHRPEFKPETMRFDSGQKLFTTFSTHRGGLCQRAEVPDDALVFELYVDCQYLSRHTDGSGG